MFQFFTKGSEGKALTQWSSTFSGYVGHPFLTWVKVFQLPGKNHWLKELSHEGLGMFSCISIGAPAKRSSIALLLSLLWVLLTWNLFP